MRYSSLVSASTIISAALAASDAPVINNTPGAWAIANMPGGGDKNIVAQFAVAAAKDGGVSVSLNINGLTLQGRGFSYHIHEKAVPSDGNCTGTGAHLDPLGRGEDPKCDNTNPASCQVGDLSGKHGTCASIPGCSKNFTDKYLSLTPGNAAYIGDKSIVIHYPNKTRIACANFVLGNSSSFTGGGNSSTSTSSSTPSSASSSGSATAGGAGVGGSSISSGASATASSSGAETLRWSSTGALVMVVVGALSLL